MIGLKEEFKIIPDCPNYEISNTGRIINTRTGKERAITYTKDGYAKINLHNADGIKRTYSVAKLVAEAFVERPMFDPSSRIQFCDHVVILDGNLSNVSADNLVWRPRWIAWKYREQLTTQQPGHYYNLRVVNLRTGIEYNSIIEAGMKLGLLFALVYRSTFAPDNYVFPYWDKFEISGRNDLL